MRRATDTVDPDRARAVAHHILGDRRFRRGTTPRPLHSPLRWLGDRLRDIGDAIAAVFRAFPGPTWLVSSVFIVAITVLFVVWLLRQRRIVTAGSRAGGAAGGGAERLDPGALEAAADAAERAGDLDRALRLRFQAGLLRLNDRGAIRYRPSLTTSEVRRRLDSAAFDDLATRFEEVAYGGRTAAADDLASARARWPAVLEDATRK